MRAHPRSEPAVRVTTLELFFDLVFVFTVTQLTQVLAGDFGWLNVLRVTVLLGVIFWMYAGYAWLTNAVTPTSTTRRTLLLVGMSAFLGVALAVPTAYQPHGAAWEFGIAYFVINIVHSALFLHAAGDGALPAIRGLATLNLLTASLVVAGGFAPVGWRLAIWTAAMFVQLATPYLHRIGGFNISAGHFVERHGLIIIIALGESIVAIGVGAASMPVDFGLLAVAVTGLVVVYYLWWAYFSGDDARAEHALNAADPARRPRLALWAFGYAHYPMLIGIVVVAAGIKQAVGHAHEPLSTGPALALAGGVALFLLGQIWFRRIVGATRSGYRLVAVVAALATIPLGAVNAALQLAALVVALAVPLSVEGYRVLRRSGFAPNASLVRAPAASEEPTG